ncbi:MAG: hypothetical protein AB7O97_22665 [Planctomycetota bacterium]
MSRRPGGRRALPALLLALAALAAPARAQLDRHELGLRLCAFERELDATADPERRDRALQELARAVRAFFGLAPAAVAVAIDDATWALRGVAPSPEQRWAAALQLRLARRLVARGSGTVVVHVGDAFLAPRVPGPPRQRPDGATLEVTVGDGPVQAFALDELPCTLALALQGVPAGDLPLRWRVRSGDTTWIERQQGVSVAEDLAARLDRIDEPPPHALPALEAATLPHLARLVRGMTRPRAGETVLPGARLLAEAEALRQLPEGGAWYGPTRPGDFWLRVPLGPGPDAEVATVRLVVPAGLRADRPVPLVLALHGAGGSENLFCDGYGDGAIVARCAERGWILCAPRSSGFGGVDAAALAAALAKRFPVDLERTVLVGHSMGAMQATGRAVAAPRRFAAVAALGGGGAVRAAAGLTELPFLVATGGRDFARDGALALAEALRALGTPVEVWDEPAVEHLSVVQLALPTVFAFFDRVLAR